MYSRDCVQFGEDYKQKKASTVLENKYGWFGIVLNSEKKSPYNRDIYIISTTMLGISFW